MKKISVIISIFVCLNVNAQQTISVYFKNDAFTLTETQKQNLNEFIEQLGTQTISITGYTDTNGTDLYNQQLAQKRANTVKNYLLLKGIASSQINKVIGKGEDLTYTDLSKNRRVDILLSSVDTQTYLIDSTIEDSKAPQDSIRNIQVRNLESKPNGLSDINKLKVGETLVIENLNFIPGRHFPTLYSENTLKKLVRILKQNPTLKIEIQGHICCQPGGGDGIDNDTGELTLSVNRAKYVYDYLIGQGIDASRLSFVGFGADRPLVPEIDEETRQMNRRVEILILEK
jgi:outer membrane protein OmpA-like peptidoglycan-associated protein